MSNSLKFLLLATLLLASCAEKKQQTRMDPMMMGPASVRAVPVTAADVPLDISAVGNVESMATVDVKSLVAGKVLRVDFQEGQNVTQGQLLFEIDPEPIRRQLAEIQADIGKDAALIEQAKANVAKDEAQLKQTRAAADRGLELAKEGIFSKEQTEQVVATNDTTLATMAADKAAISSAEATLRSDRARLSQTQLQLTYTKITAPISGRAGAISVKAGNLIKDNDAAMVTLLQMSPIYVTFGVPEQTLPELHRGLKVLAGGKEGLLDFIDNSVDATTGTIKIKAKFENADHALWPGEYVNVRTIIKLEHDRLLIPSRAVETGPQGKYVWVLNPDQTVTMRPVDVLRQYKEENSPEQTVIASGLKPGEQVISEGQLRLMPGAKVRLLKEISDVLY